MSEQAAVVELEALAAKVQESYEEFTQSVKGLGNKAVGRSKMGGSFLRWVGGSHISTPRDQLCEAFLAKVQSQLEFFATALEGASTEERARACAALADVMLQPVPVKSNSTTDLMKRAMVSQFRPFLPYLTQEKLRECLDRMTSAYQRRQMLPVEKELVQEMEGLLRA